MIEAIIDGDREAASELANSLIDWLDRGGFSPVVLPELGQAARDSESPAYLLDRMIVSYVCARIRMIS
jgi:predicted ATP-grasp superfamily ATP-dependent carboligase